MKRDNNKFYSIFFLIILSYIIGMGVVLHQMNMIVRKTFDFHIFYFIEIIILLLFGFILGVEQFYNQWKKRGKWHADKVKILFLGLPAFVLVIWNLGPFLLMGFSVNISFPMLSYPLNILIYSKFSLYAATTVIGYVLATLFYKGEEIEEEIENSKSE